MIISPATRLNELKEYYFSVKLKEVRALIESGKKIINLGIGSPDLAPSGETIDTLIESARQPGNHGYQPYKGIAPLRKAMAKWYQDTYQVNLDPENEILPLIGSKEGITHISLTFLDPGDEVLIPELGYPTNRSVSEMVGAKVRTYPLNESNDYAPDWEKMKDQDYSHVKIMWVNYPHMPTGASANEKVFTGIIDFAQKNKILVCHDNPYSLILNDNEPLSILKFNGAIEVCLELNSLSKSHNMAGWRIGWVSGKKEYLNEILKVKSNVDSGMFLPLQHAAIKALENSPEWHRERNETYKQRRDYIYQILDKLNCSYKTNQTGLFIWAKIPENIASAENLVEILLHKYHIFVAPGFIFGTKGENFIRLSLCNDATVLSEALNRLESFNIS
ncbi:MAG: aminotransferase class I/II-fold pyridoxal phosphate-dependent enzyme [Bacteroidota bacterium]|nr:aminotransferase class I/II-fold pyridoxal phosphate-dependent enzyme [Bacteroidota bacterium]